MSAEDLVWQGQLPGSHSLTGWAKASWKRILLTSFSQAASLRRSSASLGLCLEARLKSARASDALPQAKLASARRK